MRYAWHHVDSLSPPKDTKVLGLHSEWAHPLVVVKRGKRWYWCAPSREWPLSADRLSNPLHWARMPVGFANRPETK